jgi:hypothetical protein
MSSQTAKPINRSKTTQISDPCDYNIDNLIFDEPIKTEVNGIPPFYRINLATKFGNTESELVFQMDRCRMFGIKESRDNNTNNLTGYVVGTMMFDQNNATERQRKTLETFQQIVDDKKLTVDERMKDLANLKKCKAEENERKFCGNPFLYHYQMENLCKTRVKKLSLYEKMISEDEYKKLYTVAEKLNRTGTLANRLFEAERFNGAVVMFKASTAKYIYKKYNATKVLDPTAGWGGRMLGGCCRVMRGLAGEQEYH